MIEERVDDGMIEIGDPTEEATVPEPQHKVVIEYRERGVPWMLIPPLLVLSAVGAIIAYHTWAPRTIRPHVYAPVKVIAAPEVVQPTVTPTPAQPTSTAAATEVPVPPTLTPPVPSVAVAAPAPAESPNIPAEPPSISLTPSAEIPPIPETNPAPGPATFPRVQGLGFDPKALENERKNEAPADSALAVAAKEGQPGQPERAAVAAPAERDQPREVDPDLLPPDPRLARVRQQQRLLEALRQIEADRGRFHADLKAICRKYRENSGPVILELIKRYESQVEPTSKKRAEVLLGKTGAYAGIDRAGRIELLRKLGYPEAAVLSDVFGQEAGTNGRIGERDGPSSPGEALYLSALFLLKHPPSPPNGSSRAVSTTQPGSSARTVPPASPPGPQSR